MHRLRPTRTLARIVLAWFALCIALASAAPVLQPTQMELVCSAGGTVMLVDGAGTAGKALPRHGLDCPFCLPASAPPPHAAGVDVRPHLHLVQALQPRPAVRIASLAAAPMPARGPPPFV